MQIAFILSSLSFGGAERHTIELFHSLPRFGIKTHLIYLKRREELLPAIAIDRLPDIWCADFNQGLDIMGLTRLAAHLRQVQPRLLVCINSYSLVYGSLARMVARVTGPVVEIFHSTELPANEARKHRLVYRWFFKLCACIVYVSHAQRQHWEAQGLNREQGVTIQNGVNPGHFQDSLAIDQKLNVRTRFGFGASEYLVGICAALRPEKQHDDLLEAISLLRTRGLKVNCLIIGEGTERAHIEGTIGRLGLRDCVVITGFQSDVRPFIAACDTMALVSHQVETFSLAALEAMAMGKPMIMSKVGGAAEQIISGETGFLYDRGDISTLADKLQTLAEPSIRARMSVAARVRVVNEFSLEVMLGKYAALLFSLYQK
jgi:glycosyltransferase involved in cell wall biosynthesis